MATRFGAPPHLYTKPLIYGLERSERATNLMLDLSSKNAIKLKSNQLDVALLSPIDYVGGETDYSIVPNICASSKSGNRSILLHFRQGLNRINTVAADIGLTSELVLAKIILTEKFDTNPQFIPMDPNLSVMLAKADAALVIGGPSLFHPVDDECAIDLVEEWVDLSAFPYIHAMWLARRDSVTTPDVNLLNQSMDEGLLHLEEVAASVAADSQVSVEHCRSYLNSFNYKLDEEALNGLSEFYRYAFYYGLIGEVPEIRFLSSDGTARISLN